MSIDRSAYSDATVFSAEMSAIFASRMYVGSTFDFARDNDYRSFTVGNYAITIRKTVDGLRAFNNVCLHRNALIDPLGEGTRTFRCNYHGWSYSETGGLKHAPMADENAICNRNLASYPLTEIDGLYFLGTKAAPVDAGIGTALRQAGIVPAKPFYRDTLDHACNWKLLVENVLEGYHISHVHKETFSPAGFSSSDRYECHSESETSWAKLIPGSKSDRTRAMQKLGDDVGHYYFHIHVFPDLFLSNTNGLVGFQSNLVPIDAVRTKVQWSLFELPAMMSLPAPVRAQLKEDAIRFTRTALLEDKALVESSQVGIQSTGTPFQLQPSECRIVQFHDMYSEKMHALG